MNDVDVEELKSVLGVLEKQERRVIEEMFGLNDTAPVRCCEIARRASELEVARRPLTHQRIYEIKISAFKKIARAIALQRRGLPPTLVTPKLYRRANT